MPISYVHIGNLAPNPFQTRLGEDPEHVRQLADSIKEHGLLQIPTARQIPDGEGIWQLAFGHSRWAAIKMLYLETHDELWSSMPLQIAVLSDQQMFEMAVSENRDRKDLTPIEEARAMQVYRDQFHKTSAEIGKLFHLGESAVRNKMRLLELPDAVQDQVGAGLSEGTARRLLSLQAVTSPEKVAEVAGALAAGGFETPEKVNERLAYELCQDKSNYRMGSGYYSNSSNSGDPRGGAGLWPLSWTSGNLSTTLEQWNKALDERGLPKATKDTFWRAYLPAQSGQDMVQCLKGIYPAEQAPRAGDLLVCLASPLACTTCPFYIRMDGSHWCGFKTCWLRKKKAWIEAETNRLSRELKVLVYDPETDGKYWENVETSRYINNEYVHHPWTEWLEARADHLRLKTEYSEYSEHKATGSHCAALITVSEEIRKALIAEEEEEKNRDKSSSAEHERWEKERKNRNDSEIFIDKVVVPIFLRASLFQGTSAFLLWVSTIKGMAQDKLPEERSKRDQVIQAAMLNSWLNGSVTWEQKKRGPAVIADYMESLAVTLGVRLPADWIDQVREFAPEYGKEKEAEVDHA
jgi:ParB/RepB/Spo0J family partition protein